LLRPAMNGLRQWMTYRDNNFRKSSVGARSTRRYL
jgi:hypothetical protein